jgi:L-rhamnose mutarotase
MERYCFTFDVVAGQEDEYKRRHDEIWPELVVALKDAGISNYSLFRRGRQVIAYCECEPDAVTAFGRVGATEVNARWAAWFEDVIERLTDPDGNLFVAEEVWHLD